MAVPPTTTPRSGTWGMSRRWQYDVEIARQRGVSAFVWEDRVCDPLLNLALLGWTATASSTCVRRSAVRRQRRLLRCV
jgi:hypothetical protein